MVTLPPKQFALLKYFMEHKESVVDRETLISRIWGYDYEGNDRVVDNHIKKLRKALKSGGKHIKTVVARGYKMTEKI
jgi:DNA-binding response OmpR family regulator